MPPLELIFRRNVVTGREDDRFRHLFQSRPPEGVHDEDPGDPVLVVLDPEDLLFLVGGEQLHRVSADAERPAVEVHVVALVLQVDQPPQQRVAGELRAFLDADRGQRASSQRTTTEGDAAPGLTVNRRRMSR